MDIIQNYFLKEHFPKNPDDVVIKNSFYPNGLTEIQIYKYYMQVKPKLLGWIGNRNVMFFLRMDNDHIVVKRKINGKPIILTSSNYEKLVTGRTNQIHVEHPRLSNYFVIDIDAGEGIGIRGVLEAANALPGYLNDLQVKKWEQLFTSPHGIQVVGYLQSRTDINTMRKSLIDLLSKQDRYLVNKKGRHPGTINFDMSPNYKRGSHLARYSLTKEGLICDDILSSKSRAGKKI